MKGTENEATNGIAPEGGLMESPLKEDSVAPMRVVSLGVCDPGPLGGHWQGPWAGPYRTPQADPAGPYPAT